MNTELKRGDKVRLQCKAGISPGVTDELMQYAGKTFKIRKVKQIKARRGGNSPAVYGTYYELRGCESARGIPFAVLREWLQPV